VWNYDKEIEEAFRQLSRSKDAITFVYSQIHGPPCG